MPRLPALPAPAAREVFVAGSFDPYWQKRHPMKKRADGRWHVVLDLPFGRYEFQFLVDGKWTIDPRLPTVEDGLGGVKVSGRGTVEDAAVIKAALAALAVRCF